MRTTALDVAMREYSKRLRCGTSSPWKSLDAESSDDGQYAGAASRFVLRVDQLALMGPFEDIQFRPNSAQLDASRDTALFGDGGSTPTFVAPPLVAMV